MFQDSPGAGAEKIPAIVAILYLVVHISFKIVYFPGYFTSNDSPTFIEPAISIVDSFRFGDMIWRTPIYPLFLAAHYAAFDVSVWLIAVCYSQIGLAAASVFLLAKILLGERVRLAYVVAFGVTMVLY